VIATWIEVFPSSKFHLPHTHRIRPPQDAVQTNVPAQRLHPSLKRSYHFLISLKLSDIEDFPEPLGPLRIIRYPIRRNYKWDLFCVAHAALRSPQAKYRISSPLPF
jgi:hypothetical protein